MLVAINKKYKYLTYIEHCPKGENFEDWVMQKQFETHSVLEIEEVDKEYLRFDHFDYDDQNDEFTFNRQKYDSFILSLNKQEQIRNLEILLEERYQAYGKLLATDADPVEIEEVKDEIALILEELGGLYDA